jgi:hypothetical protein
VAVTERTAYHLELNLAAEDRGEYVLRLIS